MEAIATKLGLGGHNIAGWCMIAGLLIVEIGLIKFFKHLSDIEKQQEKDIEDLIN